MGKKCLLMVDVQKEFKDKNGGYEKCIKYFNENKDKYDRIYATIFENNENINPRYINHLN
jgi:endonuclease YncB( thermonuclease family)